MAFLFFHSIKNSDKIDDKGIIFKFVLDFERKGFRFSAAEKLYLARFDGAVSLNFGRQQNKLRHLGNVLVAAGDLFAIAIKYVALGAPIHTEIVPAVLGFFQLVSDAAIFTELFSVSAHNISRRCHTITEVFHDIRFDTGPFRLKARADRGRLRPER